MAYFKGSTRTLMTSPSALLLTGIIADTSFGSPFPYVLKAGTMGINDCLEIWYTASVNNDADNKVLRIKFGATTVINQTLTSTVQQCRPLFIFNRGALNSQIATPGDTTNYLSGLGTTTLAVNTFAVDTAADVNIDVSGQIDAAGDTITLQSFIIKHHIAPN